MSAGDHGRPELLAPAGNWDCARAAVAAGADAVYFGLPRFNARLRADNFATADLRPLMDYLHRHGVRGFAAMNTLVFTGELEEAAGQVREMAEAGVDAVIVQDLGLAAMIGGMAPALEIHGSTQMTVTSPEGLEMLRALVRLDRIVLARELSVREIGRFRAAGGAGALPIEVFVHGALCVAYSGQCLTSEALGRRSANRGECAQACRMPYELVVDGEVREMGEVRYLLSPQDLAAVDLLPELLAAGVGSFKIEGRLKTPEYVAAVTSVYRKALDAAIAGRSGAVGEADRYALEMTFSRGLTSGWLAGTDHPYLVHGRYGKKRGPVLGVVEDCGPGWVRLGGRSGIPVVAGDGVVFDAGENRDEEQGARVWKVEGDRLLFHRRHSGLDFGRIRPGQVLCKTSDPRLESALRKFWQGARPSERKRPLDLEVVGAVGRSLELRAGGVVVRSEDPIQPAQNHPVSLEVLRVQLGRLGGTPYELASLVNHLEGDCHLPVSLLNRMRRKLVEALERGSVSGAGAPVVVADYRHLLPERGFSPAGGVVELSVLCRSMDQLGAAIECGVRTVYCDFEDPRRYREAVGGFRAGAAGGARILLATPRILKPGEAGYLRLIAGAAPDGLLIRNPGALRITESWDGLLRVGDFSLNVTNPITARLLMEGCRLDALTVSHDLNIGQVLDLLGAAPPGWFELVLHQHMPMFHMEHCVFCAFLSKGTSHLDCGRPCETRSVHLRDRVGQLHRLQADVGCRNTLFSGRAQTGARHLPELVRAGLRRCRVELLDEDRDTAVRTLGAYQRLLRGEEDPAAVLGTVHAIEKLGVTEGTLSGDGL